jgi:hypothetical protein
MNVLCESSDKVAAENYLPLNFDRMFHQLYQCKLCEKFVRDKIDTEICVCIVWLFKINCATELLPVPMLTIGTMRPRDIAPR